MVQYQWWDRNVRIHSKNSVTIKWINKIQCTNTFKQAKKSWVGEQNFDEIKGFWI